MKNKTYRYITRTAAGSGRYTTQASPQGKVTTAEVIADLAAATGLPPAQTEAVLRTFCEYVIERTTDSWRIEPLFDLLGFNASSGGIFDSYTIAPTFDNLNLSLNMVVGRSGYNLARNGFSASQVGSQGRVVPVIKSVTNSANNSVNTYTPNCGLELTLSRYGTMDLNDPDQGVFFTNSSNVVTPAINYMKTNGQTVIFNAPAGLTGPQQLSIIQNFSGENRTGVFDFPLLPTAMLRRLRSSPSPAGNGHSPTAGNGNGNGHGHAPRSTRPATVVTPARTRSRTGSPKAKPPAKAKTK